MIRTSDKALAFLTLFSGLTISAVAIWYSVAGLVAIFAAATLPIIVMGTVLEVSKLVATVWLKWNWKRAPALIRTYLLAAIAVLMLLTSMGIFGFLSKAHLDQAVPTGDVAAKVAIIDEKIKTERDNIESAKKALAQMDATVDQTISRSTNENGATRAAQLRRSQQKERAQLQTDISNSQKAIAALNQERAPIAAELRKVEAEVGPIKYIAALIYGDNPDANLLERAVRWVIIIIVLVFDPLAVILLLASQYSFQWFRNPKDFEDAEGDSLITESQDNIVEEATVAEIVDEPVIEVAPEVEAEPVLEPQIDAQLVKSEIPEFTKIVTTDVFGDLSSPKRFGLVDEPAPAEPAVEEVSDEDVSVERPGDYLTDYSVVEEVKEPEIDLEVEELIEDHDDDDILEDAEQIEKDAMKRWKEEHPNDSLKHQRKLYEMKIIDQLPWHEYLSAKPDYVQNAEQGAGTIWQKLKASKPDA